MLFRSVVASLSRTAVPSRSLMSPTGHEIVRGTVRQFNPTKGYGFIRPGDGSADCFVHQSAILGYGFRTLQGSLARCLILNNSYELTNMFAVR